MATPPSAPRGTTRRTFDRRVLLALAAVVSLIIVGLYQFDQVVASIYAYAYGAFPRIVGSPVGIRIDARHDLIEQIGRAHV